MKKRIIFGSIFLVVCLLYYVGMYEYNDRQIAKAANIIMYNEKIIGDILAQSGVNSSTWDEFDTYIAPQDGLGDADEIDSLPGQPNANFSQYSGYVTVDDRGPRQLFYYFAESAESPTTKPLVLWLNGGPPCSSLIGALVEIGPFRVMKDGATLGVNPYAWNTVANILFLETPAGVGFSYSNTTSDYELVGDKLTAQDSYTFLINWLERFPAYKSRDFYITGENYAGHYATQLGRIIIQKNEKETPTRVINLRGIAVGNAVIDETCTAWGTYDFLYNRALFSKDVRDALRVCDFQSKYNNIETTNTINCESAATTFASASQRETLSAPSCNSSSDTPQNHTKFDPCTNEYTDTYLNNPEVIKALHAKVKPWTECSIKIPGWNDEEPTVLLSIKELMASGLRIWLYSGDADTEVTAEGTELAINALGLSIKTERYPWYNAPNEIAGYATEYYNLTFVTVKGVGSLVPSYEPAKALTIFSSFLEGKLPPSAE